MIIVADGVFVGEEFEEWRIAILHVEERHCLPGVMRRIGEWCAVGRRYRRLEIMQTTRWVIPGYVLCVDGTIHLLDHLEIPMRGVAGKGVEWHRRAGHLERPRREGVDVGNADIGTKGEVQTRASGGEEELIRGRQARIAARDAKEPREGRYWANASYIGRRQRGIQFFMPQIRAAEEFGAIGCRNDLILMSFGEIRARRAIGIYDSFGQEVPHPLLLPFRHICGEEMIEAAILADNDDDVLDGRGCLDRIDRPIWIGCVGRNTKAQNG